MMLYQRTAPKWKAQVVRQKDKVAIWKTRLALSDTVVLISYIYAVMQIDVRDYDILIFLLPL